MTNNKASFRSAAESGFTLVETLIVVLILAIVAAIVVPRISNATSTARSSMLADDLRVIRMQLTVFKGVHRNVAAGYPGLDAAKTPTQAALKEHLLKCTKENGEIAEPGTAGFQYGPYFRQMPLNPINQLDNVLVIDDSSAFPTRDQVTGQYGWIYQPKTMTFKAGCIGKDEEGKDFYDY